MLERRSYTSVTAEPVRYHRYEQTIVRLRELGIYVDRGNTSDEAISLLAEAFLPTHPLQVNLPSDFPVKEELIDTFFDPTEYKD